MVLHAGLLQKWQLHFPWADLRELDCAVLALEEFSQLILGDPTYINVQGELYHIMYYLSQEGKLPKGAALREAVRGVAYDYRFKFRYKAGLGNEDVKILEYVRQYDPKPVSKYPYLCAQALDKLDEIIF